MWRQLGRQRQQLRPYRRDHLAPCQFYVLGADQFTRQFGRLELGLVGLSLRKPCSLGLVAVACVTTLQPLPEFGWVKACRLAVLRAVGLVLELIQAAY